jgi:uncharacterized protein YcbK (DUF882 family)
MLPLLVIAAALATPPRFFVEGDGRLVLLNAHTGARVDVRYRDPDGRYDEKALGQIRHAFRSKGDRSEGRVSLRLIEVLSHLQQTTDVRPLRLQSGYRKPEYNEALRKRGVKAAGGSLHTDGLAADVAFPRPILHDLWLKLRALECCGAGYYEKDGFLHVDVGRPRFWEPSTSRVEENISAGNARLFARTEFDRYAVNEPIVIQLHALTTPPVRVARAARVAGTDVRLAADGLPERDGCLEVRDSSAAIRAAVDRAIGRDRLVLSTCAPRPERTPETIETNWIEVRGD